MAEQLVIARRFNGPPDSAQGGYACGLVSERIDASVATISLRRPPPLERPLEVCRRDGGAALLDGEQLVAEGAASELELEVPEPRPPTRGSSATRFPPASAAARTATRSTRCG